MPPRPGQKAATALQDVETRQQTGQVMLLEFIELAGSGGWGQLWDVVGQMHPAAPDQATSANPLQPTEVSMALKLLLSWAYLPSRVKSAYSGLPEYMQKQTEALGSEAACMLACQNEEVVYHLMFKHKSCHKSNKTAFNRMARCMLWVVAPVGMCLCCMLVLSWQHIFRKGSHCGPIVHATKSRNGGGLANDPQSHPIDDQWCWWVRLVLLLMLPKIMPCLGRPVEWST
eukprot:jgi/Chrzof1/1001/Cz01g36120.t1